MKSYLTILQFALLGIFGFLPYNSFAQRIIGGDFEQIKLEILIDQTGLTNSGGWFST